MAILKSLVRDSGFEAGVSSSSGGEFSADSHSGLEDSRNSSDDDSGMKSDDCDYSDLAEAGSELCQVGDWCCSVPYELYDLPDLKEVLCADTWNNCLTEEERLQLAEYLPDMDQETFLVTLRELFSGKNFHFGSPTMELYELLKGGQGNPPIALYRHSMKFFNRRKHYYAIAEYQNSMVDRMLEMKDVLDNCDEYGTEERMHALNLHLSRKRLGNGEQKKLGTKTEFDSDRSFMARWNRKLNHIGALNHVSDASLSPLSSRGRMEEDPSRCSKEHMKGSRKVASSKTPLEKGRFGYDTKGSYSSHTRGALPSAGLSHMNHSAASDYKYFGKARTQNKLRDIYHEDVHRVNADEEESDVRRYKPKIKCRKEKLCFKKPWEQPLSLDNGDEEDQDYNGLGLFSRKNGASQMLSAVSVDVRSLKKSRLLDVEKGASVKSNAGRLSMKEEWGTISAHSHRGNAWRDELSVGNHGGHFERSTKKKRFQKEESNAYNQKYASHAYEDHTTRSPAWNSREKYSHDVEMDLEYVNRQSFLRKEETDSDSSKWIEEEESFPKRSKKNKHLDAVTSKHQVAVYELFQDRNGSTKAVQKIKNDGLLTQMHEEEAYLPAAHKTKTRVNNSVHGYASKSPSPRNLFDSRKYMYEMGKETLDDHDGDRSELSPAKNHSVDRLRLGTHPGIHQPNKHDHSTAGALMEFDEIHDIVVDRAGMLEIAKAEVDSNGQLCLPLSGCNSLATKRKLEKSRKQQGGSDKLYDAVALKKNAKKKTSEVVPVTTLDHVSPPKEIAAEPESKASRKPFTPITPTVHTGFSFSVVHLLSAIRKAMVTMNTDDPAEVGNVEDRKDNSVTNSIFDKNNMPSLTVQEIVNRVKSNPGDPCILETQEPLQDLVRGVLKIFSSKTAPLAAKSWKPLVNYERSTKTWSWVGPLPHNALEPIEEETSPEAWDVPHKMLVKLVDAFANWLKSGQETLRKIGSLPPPPVIALLNLDDKERFKELRAQKSLNTISPSTDEVREYFRKEEFLRYQIPERAFSYTAADGKKSIVAPLRRGGGKPTSKARDHFMLKPRRPPHVTILCLVRDAAARLPGSIGTRADVCTLIRDSQYIVEDVSDSQVNQVVSGALDRLHYERDPCVQYDSERKLWVYLHRDREEEDFEDDGTSSTKKWKRPKKDATENADAEPVVNASQHFDEDEDAGVLSLFNINPDSNMDPSSTQMGEKSELLYSDLRPINENVEPLVTSIQGSSYQGQLSWDVLSMNHMKPEDQLLCEQNCTNEEFEDETFGRGRPVGY